MQWVSQITARVGKVFQRGRVQIGGGVRVLRIDQWSYSTDLDRLIGMCHLKREIHRLLLAQARQHIVVLPRLETFRLDANRIRSGF